MNDASAMLALLGKILDALPDPVWLKDREGRYLSVNRAAGEWIGGKPDDIVGKTDRDFFGPAIADRYLATDREAERAGEPWRRAGWVAYPNGRRCYFETVKTPIFEDGRLVGVLGVSHDVTERMLAENALRQYRDNLEEQVAARTAELSEAEERTRLALVETTRLARLRSDFVANMSHEIRTPLNAMLGLAQIGIRDNKGRKCHETFVHIREAGQTLLAIVNDILDFSKIEAGKLDVERLPLRLGEAIDRAVSLTAARAYDKGLDLTIEESPDLPETCLGDPMRLAQVLINLLGNAIKFTERGRVALVVRRCSRDEPDGPCLVFRVEDTGIGMGADDVARLFRPFEQSDTSTTRLFGGTGLGLTISKRLADMMGGSICVSSRPGEGSVFELRLPLAEDAEVLPSPPQAAFRSARLVGLPLDESAALSADLRRHGIRVEETVAARAFEAPLPEAVVMDILTALDPAVAEAARPSCGGLHLVVVATPGDLAELPEIVHRCATLAERPLNLRRLRQALRRKADDLPASFGPGTRLSGISVLAAEDNPLNQMVLEDILIQEKAELTLAGNGVKCLELLTQRGAHAFDIVLTDIQMPEMDGYELTRRIRALAPHLPVAGLTAHAMPRERQRCLDAGMNDYLSKPFDIEDLVALVLRNLPSREMAPENAPPTAPRKTDGDGAAAADIDWAALEARYANRPGFVRKIAEIARNSIADDAGQLREAAAKCDCEAAAFLAHRLKGTAGHLMARSLLNLAVLAENAAKAHAGNAGALVERLAEAVEKLDRELLAYNQNGGPSP